ncbi:MAG: hypothetical protein HY236_03700 [Acidobacteria bacterium]|nr:hypothetical protein [Acidobacteriota bacterium]
MKASHRVLVSIFALATGTALLVADTIHLRNGKRVDGTFVGGDTRQVRLMGADGNLQTFDITDVQSIHFSSPGGTAPAAAAAAAAAPAPAARTAAPAVAAPAADASQVVPAGTVITVRMIDSVDSDVTSAGERFRASLDDPLQIGEKVIAPRGADVTVQVVRVQQSGKLTGRDEVALELYDLDINGRKYQVASSYAEVQSGSRGARTGKVVGGGAALGAIIGAIAGGGKGAAIGAATGAGAGVAVEMATKGQRVKIPSEARLEFTLKQPLAVE